MKRASKIGFLLPLLSMLWVSSLHGMVIKVHEKTVEGRIFVANTKAGIPNLTVKLIAPKSLRKAEKITTTDQSGKFTFKDIDKGRYLLEVYQGVTLLYRQLFDTTKEMTRTITLRTSK